MYHGCLLWYTEINHLLEISEKLEKELPSPWKDGDSLERSLTTWRVMVTAFLRELEQLTEGSPYFLDSLRDAKIVASRLLPFGESVLQELEKRVGTVSTSLDDILKFYKQKQKTLGELQSVSDISRLSLILVEEINKTMTVVSTCSSLATLNESVTSRVTPLLSQCIHFASGQKEYLEDFHICFKDYEDLCKKVGEPIQDVASGRDGLHFLKEQISILAGKITPTLEQEIIRQVMNGVMLEKGFPHVGFREKTLKNGAFIVEDLFLYRQGVGVSVLYRWDRKIILVVGGISKNNREPSIDESRGIREYILSFQENLPYIQEKMLRKGVILGEQLSEIHSLEDVILLNQNEFQCPTEVESFGNHGKKTRVLQQEKGGL